MSKTFDEWNSFIARTAKSLPNVVKKALTIGTREVRTEAVLKHLSGPKMPKGIGDPKNATLARQSGDLAGSIQTKVKVDPDKVYGKVFTNMKYAGRHERGTDGMPKRPFLNPSLDAKEESARELVRKAILEALNG